MVSKSKLTSIVVSTISLWNDTHVDTTGSLTSFISMVSLIGPEASLRFTAFIGSSFPSPAQQESMGQRSEGQDVGVQYPTDESSEQTKSDYKNQRVAKKFCGFLNHQPDPNQTGKNRQTKYDLNEPWVHKSGFLDHSTLNRPGDIWVHLKLAELGQMTLASITEC